MDEKKGDITMRTNIRPSRQVRFAVIVLTAAAVLATSTAYGAKPLADVDDRFEETSRVVAIEVPVHVLGRDGQPVRGLTREDFKIFDEGKEQEIVGFEALDLKVLANEPRGPRASEQLRATARRHFLLLFDLSFSSPTAIVKARRAAREFVIEALEPTDLVAVATISVEHGPRLVVTFTPDRAQIARGIDTLGARNREAFERFDPLRFVIDPTLIAAGVGDEGQSRDLLDTRLSEALFDISGQATAQNQKNQKLFDNGRVSGMARALSSVARSLNSVRGRKHVVFFSEGFDSRLLLGRSADQVEEQASEARDVVGGRLWLQDNDNRYGNTELQGEIGRALEEFRRADSVIQAVDIGGLRASADVVAIDRGAGREALFYLANDTGGELFEATNDLRGHLEKVLDHTEVTYLLTFQRSDLKEDGAYRRLRVKASLPPGARLTHRSGYYAPRPFQQLDPLEKNLLASEGIATATPKNDLDLSLLIAPFRAGPQLAYVPVIIEVGGESLLTGQKGERLAVEVYTYVSDDQGQMRDFFTQQVGVSLKPDRESFRTGGLKYYGHFDLAPGSYRVRVLVRNAETGRTGVTSMPLEVPAFGESQPELLPPLFMEAPGSWLLVRERDPGEGRASVVYPFTVKGEPYVPSARPALENGKEAKFCLVAYNFGDGDLSVDGHIVGADGSPIEGGRLALVERTATGISGLDRLLATFEPQGLKAGEYRLQVAVTDRLTGHREANSLPFVID